MIRMRWALATLLATCLLGACSDDAEPDIADPTASASSSSATVSPSPTVTATPQTLAPRETVDAWLAAWSSALTSGDVEDVLAISSPECESCNRLFDRLTGIYEKGGRLKTDGWRASRVNEARDSVSATPSFVMQVTQAHQVLYDENGSVANRTPSMRLPMRMTFQLAEGVWLLSRLEILE